MILLVITGTLGEKKEELPKPTQASDCRKYNNDYRVAVCAGSLKEQGLITKRVFNSLMDLAKSMGNAPSSTYYSVGITTGRATRLVASKMFDPVHDKYVSIGLDPRDVYHEVMYYDNIVPVDKPVLIYLKNNVDGIPALNDKLLSNMHPMGNPVSGLRVYRNGPIMPMSKAKDGCGKFGQWDYLQSAKQMVGAAIVMPADMWCPGTAQDSFDIMYGEYEVMEHESTFEQFLMPMMQKSSNAKHNINDLLLNEVF